MNEKPFERDPETVLDKAISEIRNEPIDPTSMDAAANRVWANIAKAAAEDHPTHRITGCDDFRALFPAYRDGSLSQARRLLMEDHLHECVACRKALQADRAPIPMRPVAVAKPARRPWSMQQKYAAAAALFVTAGLSAWFAFDRFAPVAGPRMTVESLRGPAFRITDTGIQPLKEGESISEREPVLTAASSRAVLRLRDGSAVEMNERAQFSVSATRRDTTVNLDRGVIIVQAAKRRTGHLYVAANDCRVAVTGTVFSVNRGTKGSRVSVIEGEVYVTSGGNEKVLHSGDQLATDASMTATTIRDEIAWSQNLGDHLELLKQFAVLRDKLEHVALPGLRYTSRLLNAAPANSVVVAALPNLGDAVNEAYRIFQQQLRDSSVLNEWWTKSGMAKQSGELEQTIEKFRSLTSYLGEEVIFALPVNDGKPVFYAEVKTEGIRALLEAEKAAGRLDVRIIDQAGLSTTAGANELVVLLRPGYVIASPDITVIREVNAHLDQAANPFVGTRFYERINAAYREGASIVVAADLERLATSMGPNGQKDMQSLGFNEMRYLVVEQKQIAGDTQQRAALSFAGMRRGIPSWLGAPGPMGTLDYVSQNAQFAASFIVKNPTLMLEDLYGFLDGMQRTEITQTEQELGFRLKEDLASALGSEITVAIDGPLLPVPSWKVAAEVYDPGRVERYLRQFVEAADRIARQRGLNGVIMTQQVANGRTYFTIKTSDPTPIPEVHFVFNGGHMLMAPSRGLLDEAIQYRNTGNSLARSSTFMSLLPRDRNANFSAAVYQNAGSILGSLAQLAGNQTGGGELKPTLIVAYGEADRILLANNGGILGSGLNAFIGPAGLATFAGSIGTNQQKTPYKNLKQWRQ